MSEIEICRRILADLSNVKWRAKILVGAYDDSFTMHIALAAFSEGLRLRPLNHEE